MDGSKLDNRGGYGAILLDPEDMTLSQTKGSLGESSTVFQAECIALTKGLEDCVTNNPEALLVLTDNQALVKALDNPYTTSKTVKHVKETLNNFGTTTKITVRWVRAHVGHFGNELADGLAKEGSKLPLIGPDPFVPLPMAKTKEIVRNTISELWKERWNKRKDARQTGIFFPTPNPKASLELSLLSKQTLGIVGRALTGHDFRPRHAAILEKTPPPSCSFCWREEESPSHLILTCPRFNHLRANIFGSYTADIIRTWTVKQIVAFLSEPSISEGET